MTDSIRTDFLLKKMYIEQLTEELPVLRIKLGLSQDEMGSMIGLSRQSYSAFETKKRKMTWSVFLSLIFIFDNSGQTHEFIRQSGLFPEKLFEEKAIDVNEDQKMIDQFISPDLKFDLDEQAIHAIETVIMVEYARCNNIPGNTVVKAFDGKRFRKITEKDTMIQNALNALKR